ncbi:MAG: conjugal transfer protein TraF [Oleiphilaceae bacterium]|nr:conjugal transfer protein TraF [Oleiphilaceae bacterium]
MNLRKATLACVIAAWSGQSFAGGPSFLDSRAFAMGGVGVASARPAAASFYNPALLAVKQKEKSDGFGLILPSISVAGTDQDELVDSIDDFDDDFLTPFENAIDAIEQDIDNLQNPNTTGSRAEFDSRLADLNQELVRIDGQKVLADLGLGISVQFPSETLGIGTFVSSSANISLTLNYEDEQYLSVTLPAQVQDAIDNNDSSRITYDETDPNNNLQSNVRGVGIATTQAGVTLARNFEIQGRNVAVGVSPKVVDFRVFDYTADVDDFESDDISDSEEKDTSFNFDVGVASYLDDHNRWLAGFSVINVLSQELTTNDTQILGPTPFTVEGVTIELQPTVTAGISYSRDSYILSADLQLNKHDKVEARDQNGQMQELLPARQMIGFGAEYDAFETVQIRLGIRDNLEGDLDPVLTAGLGLSVFGATFELAAAGNDDTIGASLQLGSTF